MEEKKLIGWCKFYSKKKNQWYLQAHLLSNSTQFDKEHGHCGEQKCELVFIPDKFWSLFENANDSLNGKTLQFHYVINGRFMALDNITVK